MSQQYRYDFALDQPTEPWTGPFRSHAQATLAAHRDGHHERVVYIRASIVLGPGSWMEVGVERIEPKVGQ